MSWLDFMVRLFTDETPRQASPRPAAAAQRQGGGWQPTAAPPAVDPLFWGDRSRQSKQIVREQVYSIAKHMFTSGVQFDEENAHWVVIPEYWLPKAWKGIARSTSLMIVFPTLYPEIPPIGFYLKSDLPRAPGGHFYEAAYHDAAKEPLKQGWKWYCVYVNPGSWQPASYRGPRTWERGDNLWTYMTLIKEALSSTAE